MKIEIKYALERATKLQEQNRVKQAARLLEATLKQCRETVGSEHQDTATALNALGLCHWRQDRANKAEACFKEACEIMKRLGLLEDCRLSMYLLHAAMACHQQDKAEEGRELLTQAADIQKRLLPPDHALVVHLLGAVNAVAEAEGQNTVGRAVVMAEYMYIRGYHSAVAAHALAQNYIEQEKWAEAKALTLYQLQMLNEVFGPDHTFLGEALGEYGWLAEECGDTTAAICAYNQELLILMNTTPDDLTRKEKLLWKLADLYQETGDLTLCSKMLDAIEELTPKCSSPTWPTAQLVQFQALVLYGQHKMSAALPLAKKAVRQYAGVEASGDMQGEALYLLALIYQWRGEDGSRRDLEKARTLFDKAIKQLAASEEGKGERMAEFMESAAQTHSSLGRHKEAERLLQAALRIRQRTPSCTGPEVIGDLNNLAVSLMGHDGYCRARPLLKRALQLARQANCSTLIAPLNNLAIVEAVHRRYAIAARLNQQAIDIIEQHHADRGEHLAMSFQNQGTLLALAGRTAEAETNYQKAVSICEAKGLHAEMSASTLRTELACLKEGRFKKTVRDLWRIRSECFQQDPDKSEHQEPADVQEELPVRRERTTS